VLCIHPINPRFGARQGSKIEDLENRSPDVLRDGPPRRIG
jgi:hypothetical protein